MQARLAVLMLLPIVVEGAKLQGVDQEALRRTVGLPMRSVTLRMGSTIGFTFSAVRGFYLRVQSPDLSDEIDALRRRLAAHPEEGEGYERLAELCKEAGDPHGAEEASAQAVARYRLQAQAGRTSGPLLAQLGRALEKNGQHEEAESTLREAIRAAPREWQAWTALAGLLVARAAERVSGTTHGPDAPAEAQRLLDEARRCCDRAVTEAPTEARVYAARAMFRTGSESWLQNRIAAARDGRPPSLKLSIPRQAIDDLEQAARLSPSDPYALATAAWQRFFSYIFRQGKIGGSTAEAWQSLTEEEKQPIREIIARIERMTHVKDKHAAAKALTALGFLQYETFEEETVERAQVNLRRALALDPARQDAAAMLIHIFLTPRKYPELVSFVTDRLRRRDSVRDRMIAVYALWKLNRPEEVEAHLRAALKLDPTDFAANLALAAALLKRIENPAALSPVEERLQVAASALQPSSGPDQRSEYRTVRGIYLARIGKVAEAQREVREALDLNPGNGEAQQALGILARGAPAVRDNK